VISSSSTIEDYTCLQQGFCHLVFLCALVPMTWEPRESQKAHWDSDISCDEAFHNFWSIEVVAQTIYHVFLIQTFNSLLEIVLYLTYIGKRQRECPLHHKPYLDIQSINAYHPTKGAQVRPTIS